MSKYSNFLSDQYKNIGKVKDATRSVIKSGRDIALKEFYDANSLERLKNKIKKGG